MPLVNLLVVLVAFSGVLEALADEVPLPPFFLAKETTYFSGPLRRDGTVDYVAAMNESMGRGVTKANNAAIPFLEAVTSGTDVGQPVHFARLWKELGVAGALSPPPRSARRPRSVPPSPPCPAPRSTPWDSRRSHPPAPVP